MRTFGLFFFHFFNKFCSTKISAQHPPSPRELLLNFPSLLHSLNAFFSELSREDDTVQSEWTSITVPRLRWTGLDDTYVSGFPSINSVGVVKNNAEILFKRLMLQKLISLQQAKYVRKRNMPRCLPVTEYMTKFDLKP